MNRKKQRLRRGVEEPRRCLSYQCCSGLFDHRSQRTGSYGDGCSGVILAQFTTAAKSPSWLSSSPRCKESQPVAIKRLSPQKQFQLFVSERHHGIDPHSPPRRQVGSEQRDAEKQEGDADEGDAIDGVESIEHAAQQIRGSNGETYTDQQSCEHRARACRAA